ncbi:hypothetical protein [Desulfurivibrio alkaliphilus]|uniref:DsrE family protein n=1 Tax=Desulfurivibrio alkaliphilus (strain DSM 19089 / UNIQEM U267 / AHT2) TaxID=589865 RepID=D6Z1I5_DESAT|nr:hypothetical protein [Desulfurivibrio alkaliphilus]ADH87319.1 hypothetical protein DaAHT2_2660 [Desulfurivibrio alkaliphilus AHT 2]
MLKKIFLLLVLGLLPFTPLAGGADPAPAEYCQADEDGEKRPGDRAALAGVEVGRIFWDVTIADPWALAGRLGVIEETYCDMVRQGVTPEMVLAFRGGATRLLNADPQHLPEELREGAAEVQRHLQTMLERPGVQMEACYIAMGRVPLEPENLMPGVKAVGNTFLSAMGYGQKGYVSIPIY